MWASWGFQAPGRPARCPCWLQGERPVCTWFSPLLPSCLPGTSLPWPWGDSSALQPWHIPMVTPPTLFPPTPSNYLLSSLFIEHLARAIYSRPQRCPWSSRSGDFGSHADSQQPPDPELRSPGGVPGHLHLIDKPSRESGCPLEARNSGPHTLASPPHIPSPPLPDAI